MSVGCGLGYATQELTRIRREALHITTLTLGKYGVEGECRFARPRQTRHYRECVVWNFEAHIFQIVNPCSFDVYLILV